MHQFRNIMIKGIVHHKNIILSSFKFFPINCLVTHLLMCSAEERNSYRFGTTWWQKFHFLGELSLYLFL